MYFSPASCGRTLKNRKESTWYPDKPGYKTNCTTNTFSCTEIVIKPHWVRWRWQKLYLSVKCFFFSLIWRKTDQNTDWSSVQCFPQTQQLVFTHPVQPCFTSLGVYFIKKHILRSKKQGLSRWRRSELSTAQVKDYIWEGKMNENNTKKISCREYPWQEQESVGETGL